MTDIYLHIVARMADYIVHAPVPGTSTDDTTVQCAIEATASQTYASISTKTRAAVGRPKDAFLVVESTTAAVMGSSGAFPDNP